MTSLTGESAVSTGDLRPRLEDALSRHFGARRSIARLERRPAARGSSYALEELDLSLADGTRLRLVFKDLSRRSMLRDGQRAKPVFLYDPLREIRVYHRLLASRSLGTATCYGTVVEPARERYWLFLERVEGVELYEIGDLTTWQEAATWLAGLHSCFPPGPRLADLAQAVHLVPYGSDFYRLWLERARAFLTRAPVYLAGPERRRLERLILNYPRVVERLAELPVAVIHGEFYASNVLVRAGPGERRICPVDWEMAALGPGLIDLAALAAGGWTEDQRRALAQAYYTELAPGKWSGIESLLDALDYCRLHLAVQWLGWSGVWSPPPQQAHNWLADALLLAEKLGL